MAIKTFHIDPDTCTSEELGNLAELYVLCAGAAITNERDTDRVMPLEAMGLASLTLADAWKKVSEDQKKYREARGL